MDKNEIIERLGEIAKHAVHTIGEEPFIMSLDNGIAVHEAIEIIQQSQPERPKGKWVNCYTDGFGNMCKCSECGARIDIQEKFRSFFCYHCGADMREDVLPSAQPVLTCKGCKYDYYEYAGCRNCLRKERELYEPE